MGNLALESATKLFLLSALPAVPEMLFNTTGTTSI